MKFIDNIKKRIILIIDDKINYSLKIARSLNVTYAPVNIYVNELVDEYDVTFPMLRDESKIIAEKYKLKNLKIFVNHNGWSAYDKVCSSDAQIRLLKNFNLDIKVIKTKVEQLPFLKGLDAHYYHLTKKDYQLAINFLK